MLKAIRISDQFPDIAKVEALAKEAFPPKEYLSPSSLIAMEQAQGFDFWSLYDGKQFVGFMTVMVVGPQAYLFFLAIAKEQRSKGYGAKAISLLWKMYPDKQQVVDMEKCDATAPNVAQREKRRHFYLANGYRPTGNFLSYLGVDYEIFCGDDHFDLPAFKELMNHIQVKGFVPRYFTE